MFFPTADQIARVVRNLKAAHGYEAIRICEHCFYRIDPAELCEHDDVPLHGRCALIRFGIDVVRDWPIQQRMIVLHSQSISSDASKILYSERFLDKRFNLKW